MLIRPQQQRCRHAAAFQHDDVVGAAGGGRIHDFHPHAALHQRPNQGRTRKPLAAAGSQQHDLRLQASDGLEMGFHQIAEALRRPVAYQPFGGDDQAPAILLLIDLDPVRAITGDRKGIQIAVKREAHGNPSKRTQ